MKHCCWTFKSATLHLIRMKNTLVMLIPLMSSMVASSAADQPVNAERPVLL